MVGVFPPLRVSRPRTCSTSAPDWRVSPLSGANGGTAKAPIHRYSFPPQETELRGDEELRNLGGDKLGTVDAISLDERWVDIKKREDSADLHPEAIFSHTVIRQKSSRTRSFASVNMSPITGWKATVPIRRHAISCCARQPRIGGQPIQHDGEVSARCGASDRPGNRKRAVPNPGTAGCRQDAHRRAHDLRPRAAGKTVGVTANSHKVIRNLLDEVVKAAGEMGVDVHCIQKPSEMEPDQPRLRFAKNNADLLDAIGNGSNVAGGTAWLWASPDAAQAVDVLFIDEAAQMSLANVLAVSQAATSVVLLGDPQQLDQPMQGSHPEGTDVSALHHILGDEQTIAADRGLFLEETWRLHPDICAYTSELFYEGRLHPRPGLENQRSAQPGRVNGTGLRYLAVPTKAIRIRRPKKPIASGISWTEILASGTTWIDKHGEEQR